MERAFPGTFSSLMFYCLAKPRQTLVNSQAHRFSLVRLYVHAGCLVPHLCSRMCSCSPTATASFRLIRPRLLLGRLLYSSPLLVHLPLQVLLFTLPPSYPLFSVLCLGSIYLFQTLSSVLSGPVQIPSAAKAPETSGEGCDTRKTSG